MRYMRMIDSVQGRGSIVCGCDTGNEELRRVLCRVMNMKRKKRPEERDYNGLVQATRLLLSY
jgi:hypothetical protein